MTSTDVRLTSEPQCQVNLGRDSLGHMLLLLPNFTQYSNSLANQCNSCRPLSRLTWWSMTSTDVWPPSEPWRQVNLGRDSLGHVLWLYSRQKWLCVTAIWTLCCARPVIPCQPPLTWPSQAVFLSLLVILPITRTTIMLPKNNSSNLPILLPRLSIYVWLFWTGKKRISMLHHLYQGS